MSIQYPIVELIRTYFYICAACRDRRVRHCRAFHGSARDHRRSLGRRFEALLVMALIDIRLGHCSRRGQYFSRVIGVRLRSCSGWQGA